MIGSNFSFSTLDNNYRNVLFDSNGSLGKLVFDSHQVGIAILLILAAPKFSFAASLIYIGVGIWTIKNSVSKYDASIFGAVAAGTHVVARSVSDKAGALWRSITGN